MWVSIVWLSIARCRENELHRPAGRTALARGFEPLETKRAIKLARRANETCFVRPPGGRQMGIGSQGLKSLAMVVRPTGGIALRSHFGAPSNCLTNGQTSLFTA